jgi:prepilin-type N-terminal cleavage/methylation domain-containing protein
MNLDLKKTKINETRSVIKTNSQVLDNFRGFSLVELIMGIVIGAILIAAGLKVFEAQKDAFEGAGEEALIRSKGRLAIRLLAKEIRLVGFGMPTGVQIISISSNSISYRASLSDLRTTIPPGDPGTNAVSIDDTSLDVVSALGFADLQNIVVHDLATDEYEFNSINGEPVTTGDPNTIPLLDPMTKDFTFGVNSRFFRVSQYNNVTIDLSGTNVQKVVDGQTLVFVDNVDSSNGLVLKYFDVNGNSTNTIADVHKISITLNLIDSENTRANIQFKTDVTLRNIAT